MLTNTTAGCQTQHCPPPNTALGGNGQQWSPSSGHIPLSGTPQSSQRHLRNPGTSHGISVLLPELSPQLVTPRIASAAGRWQQWSHPSFWLPQAPTATSPVTGDSWGSPEELPRAPGSQCREGWSQTSPASCNNPREEPAPRQRAVCPWKEQYLKLLQFPETKRK